MLDKDFGDAECNILDAKHRALEVAAKDGRWDFVHCVLKKYPPPPPESPHAVYSEPLFQVLLFAAAKQQNFDEMNWLYDYGLIDLNSLLLPER